MEVVFSDCAANGMARSGLDVLVAFTPLRPLLNGLPPRPSLTTATLAPGYNPR
jgi:hypothetical protein